MIDGYKDFVFLNQKGYPMIGAYYTSTFVNLVKKYNKSHEDELPNITPHILRHTFCTRLANKSMNPKTLQYIMGHSNINITLNLYAHVSLDGVKAKMVSLIVQGIYHLFTTFQRQNMRICEKKREVFTDNKNARKTCRIRLCRHITIYEKIIKNLF